MKETFILANNLSGNELCRSLAKQGIDICAWKVKNATALSLDSLARSGIVLNKKIINNIEQAAIVYSFLNEIEYFKNASYTDALNLVNAFHIMRSCITEDDELDEIRIRMEKGTFKKKNEAVVEAYVRYSNYIYQNDLIDSDGIIRFAIDNAKAFDANFISLKEFELSPAEKKLLDVVSAGRATEKSIYDLFDIKKVSVNFKDVSKAYGTINEVENIIEDVYKNYKLDECVIACTNTKAYSQIIYNLSLQHNIPVTFATGISINNSNPAKLLKVLVEWDNLGHNGVDALYKLLSCEALNLSKLSSAIGLEGDAHDTFIRNLAKYAGNLKLSTDKQSNDPKIFKLNSNDIMYPYAQKLAQAFELGIIGFLETYVVLRNGNLMDETALKQIVTEIEIFEKYNPNKLMSEVIPQITNATICGQISMPGSIHVTNINGLFSTIRKNVYICGLTSKEFPGKINENYLLLDSDLSNFEGAKQSEDKILDKISMFDNALSFASSCNCETKLSYPYFDLAELKEQNASSVLYKLVDDFDNLKTVNYFDTHLSDSVQICNAYKNGTEVNYEVIPTTPTSDKNLMDRAWSYSAINTYFSCPRKFYLNYVLEIPEIDPTDPFEVLNAAEFGTLAHNMMDLLGKSKIDKDTFLERCAQEFDIFLVNKPALIENKMKAVKQEFLDVMSLAYDFDTSDLNRINLSEHYLEAIHEKTGLKLHGFPDRVETDGKNTKVIDFKTSRDIKHKQDDPQSCLQGLIYAYVYSKNFPQENVVSAEFRYLRNSGVVSCAYDDAAKEKMDELLQKFAYGIKSNSFERCTSDCKYCSYGDICLFPGEIDDEKEDGNE